jgi:hypothetical protein
MFLNLEERLAEVCTGLVLGLALYVDRGGRWCRLRIWTGMKRRGWCNFTVARSVEYLHCWQFQLKFIVTKQHTRAAKIKFRRLKVILVPCFGFSRAFRLFY